MLPFLLSSRKTQFLSRGEKHAPLTPLQFSAQIRVESDGYKVIQDVCTLKDYVDVEDGISTGEAFFITVYQATVAKSNEIKVAFDRLPTRIVKNVNDSTEAYYTQVVMKSFFCLFCDSNSKWYNDHLMVQSGMT